MIYPQNADPGTFETNRIPFLDVVGGRYSNVYAVLKFGRNAEVDAEADIYDNGVATGGVVNYPFPASPQSLEIVSTSASDTEPIEVMGLAADFSLKNQTIALTGTAPVALSGTWMRNFRLSNRGSSDLIGRVHCQVAGGGDILGTIEIGNGQTLMAIYTVPAKKTGFIVRFYADLNRIGGQVVAANPQLLIRLFGEVFRVKKHRGLLSSASTDVDYRLPIPMRVPEKSDIKVRSSVTATNIDISGGFDMLIIDN